MVADEKRDKELENQVEELAGRLLYINASDLTCIAKGLPYKPHFDADYVAKLKTGGVTAIHAALVLWFLESVTTAPKRIGTFYQLLEQYPNDLLLVETADDIARAQREGKVGLIMHFHNPSAIEDDLSLVAVYHRLGLRVLQLTYQGRSLLGDGCAEVSQGGLSSFGIRVIEEMNRLGILVDLAHAGYQTYMEALDVSKAPLINSHGCVRALRDLPRNLSDEQIIALANKGGVLGIMAKSDCLTPTGATEGATLDDFLNHIEYVIKLVGVDYVGIGLENAHGIDESDIQGLQAEFLTRMHKPYEQGRVPKDYQFDKLYSAKGIDNVTSVKRNLIRGLLARGYNETDIGKVLGGNFIRVYRQVWKA